MTSFEINLKEIMNQLPVLATTEDLVMLGLFPSVSALNRLRVTGKGPAYLRLSDRMIRYPRESVIAFLKERWFENPLSKENLDFSIQQR